MLGKIIEKCKQSKLYYYKKTRNLSTLWEKARKSRYIMKKRYKSISTLIKLKENFI